MVKENKNNKKTQMIQVHTELYQILTNLKLEYMTELHQTKIPYADVITYQINKANHLTQLISRLIRNHPETKTPITETAKEMGEEYFTVIQPMLRTIGKGAIKK